MGYRSEVGLAIKESGYKIIQEEMEKDPSLKTRVECILESADNIVQDDTTKARLYYWDWYKWYDPALDNLLRDKVNTDDYFFIRVGEDYNDTELTGDYFDNPFDLRLTRCLTYSDEGKTIIQE